MLSGTVAVIYSDLAESEGGPVTSTSLSTDGAAREHSEVFALILARSDPAAVARTLQRPDRASAGPRERRET
jgi:hypothetical protein